MSDPKLTQRERTAIATLLRWVRGPCRVSHSRKESLRVMDEREHRMAIVEGALGSGGLVASIARHQIKFLRSLNEAIEKAQRKQK